MLHLACGIAILMSVPMAGTVAQESQATFFDHEDFNVCQAYLDSPSGAGAAWGPYQSWADGYLTARAETERALRRWAGRPANLAPFMRRLVDFCRERPLESFYAAVQELADRLRRGPAP